ncbi:hypothetical protein, partial [Bifidobacterium sp.]|uniref:hypothetical protein n=1 Tax=Bifidobacterium sp. TaxID=41200 RepID=UPI002E76C3D2
FSSPFSPLWPLIEIKSDENGENGDENGESREVTTPIATTAGGKTAIFNHLQTTIILHRITKRPCM